MKKPVKRRKIAGKTVKRRKKTKFSDALKAFVLVGIVVAVSALLSCAAIMIHSAMNKESEIIVQDDKEEEDVVSNPIVVTIETTPVKETVKETPKDNPSPSRRSTREEPAKSAPVPVQPPAPVVTTVSAVITPKEPVENLGTLVFVIDDAGNNLRELEPFLNISGPLTIAVLPGLPHSAEAAKRIREAGKEVILHQPMEALG